MEVDLVNAAATGVPGSLIVYYLSKVESRLKNFEERFTNLIEHLIKKKVLNSKSALRVYG